MSNIKVDNISKDWITEQPRAFCACVSTSPVKGSILVFACVHAYTGSINIIHGSDIWHILWHLYCLGMANWNSNFAGTTLSQFHQSK